MELFKRIDRGYTMAVYGNKEKILESMHKDLLELKDVYTEMCSDMYGVAGETLQSKIKEFEYSLFAMVHDLEHQENIYIKNINRDGRYFVADINIDKV